MMKAKMMRKAAKTEFLTHNILILSIFFIILLMMTTYFYVYTKINTEPAKGRELLFYISPGEEVSSIVSRLEEEGIINNEDKFVKHLISSGLDRAIQVGEFLLWENMKNNEVISIITSPQEVKKYKILIKEGQTLRDIAQIVEREGLSSGEVILLLNPKDFYIPYIDIIPVSLEGFLFPDTYIVPRLPIKDLVNLTLSNFQSKVSRIVEDSPTVKQIGFYNALILASIVEKEALLIEEKPLVASVFINRLKIGMKLESCATVNYILEKPKDRLTYNELDIDSPYNTYRYTGFPPSPISNPGFESLKAAFYPAKTDYLYFVNRGDGSHEFSRTFNEHQIAKNKYLKP